MASAMKKMAVYLGLVDEGERGYADYEYDDDYARAVEAQQQPSRREAPAAVTPMPGRRATAPAPTATSAVSPMSVGDAYRITTLHPRSYNDAKTIGLEYREGTPVIMNLTDMDDADAKRLVDFAAGLVFAQRGTIERVTSKVFLLSPANVDVSVEARATLAEGGFFNQS